MIDAAPIRCSLFISKVKMFGEESEFSEKVQSMRAAISVSAVLGREGGRQVGWVQGRDTVELIWKGHKV